MEKTYLVQIIRDLKSTKKVVAMVAPAIAGQYSVPLPQILEGVKSCGFDDVVEVALGANVTSRHEADEWEERVIEHGEPFMTTSCCPSYTRWAQVKQQSLLPYISETKTPAAYTAEWVKQQDPETITVFIGPCMAKGVEGYHDPNIDSALLDANIEKSGRQYARTGGVSASVAQYVKEPEKLKAEVINGLTKESVRYLKTISATGKADANMIEVMMCEGGCVNGCSVIANSKVATRQLLALDKE